MSARLGMVVLYGSLGLLCSQGFAAALNFQSLGGTWPYAISSDGSMIVGHTGSADGTEAFLWADGVVSGLGDLPGGDFWSSAHALSLDGSAVVGYSLSDKGGEAFLWQDGAMTGLGDLPGGAFGSSAWDISADGSIVVGASTSASGLEAFIWADDVMTGLGDLPGDGFWSTARAVSADGSTVVGASDSSYGTEAFLWRDGVMSGLGDLPGGGFYSSAYAISSDGSTVVGDGESADGREGFRWSNGTMTALGDLDGGAYFSQAYGVSSDGSTIVGQSSGQSGEEAFVWTSEAGIMNLRTVLVLLGVDLPGWKLLSAVDVSDDGYVISGLGTSPTGQTEGWVAGLPEDWIESVTYVLTLKVVNPHLGTITAEPNLARYPANSRVYLTAWPNAGAAWLGWVGDVDPNDRFANPLSVLMGKDKSVTTIFGKAYSRLFLEVFRPNRGTVQFAPPPLGGGSPYLYEWGTTVALTAQPSEGRSFKRWRLYDPNHPGDADFAVFDANDQTVVFLEGDVWVDAVFNYCGQDVGPMLLPVILGMLGLSYLTRRRSSIRP